MKNSFGEIHMTTSRPCLCFAALLFVSACVTLAQSISGTIVGSITDTSGGAVTSATVTITNEQTNLRYNAANESGEFVASNVPPGSYTVKAEFNGFKPSI